MVFPPTAYPTSVTIPDQRALIHFTSGIERLVIETRFTGSGTNFAWVVPLPTQPAIEEATTGLFPTLQYLFQPRVIHTVPRYYIGILFLIAVVYLLRLGTKSVWNCFVIAIVLLVIVILAAMLLPALSKARSLGMEGSVPDQSVSILERKLVGIFETTTIASRNPEALQGWLRENGYAVPTNSKPVIASYVKEDWVFVAGKLRRDKFDLETSTPHPLSFTFKTDRPVYPMRLTGVDNGPLSVELYVFGPSRAEASNFIVEDCTQPTYPTLEPESPWQYYYRGRPETPMIVHPLLRQWVDGSPVATKLVARLSPAEMRQDVWLEWQPFVQWQSRLFSPAGAFTIALNWGIGALAAGLLALGFSKVIDKSVKPKLPSLATMLVAFFLAVTGFVYASLPKTQVRLVRSPGSRMRQKSMELRQEVLDSQATNRAEVSAEIRRLLAQTTTEEWLNNWSNELLGGQIHEEDSPGNYVVRDKTNVLGAVYFDLVWFDAVGGEHSFNYRR